MYEDKVPALLRSIRAKCVECGCGSRENIRECEVKTCGLYPYRMTILSETEAANVDVVDLCEAIINKCINCSNTRERYFKNCDITSCPLNKRIGIALDVVYARRNEVVNE